MIVYLERFFRRFIHYKIYTIYFFSLPIIVLVRWILTGLFVKSIVLFGKQINYLFFLIVSAIFSDMFWLSMKNILEEFYRREALYECLLKGFFRIYLYKLVLLIIDTFTFYTIILLLIYLFFSKNIFTLSIGMFLSFLLILPATSLALFFSPLLIYFKGEESMIILNNLRHLSAFLVPTGFTYLYFRFYNKLSNIPIIGFVEELRRFVLFGEINYDIFIRSLVFNLVLFIIGIVFFVKVLNYARLKGWIGLK